MQREEAVRKEIGREGLVNEALVETGNQIDNLKREIAELKMQARETNAALGELRALISLLINPQTESRAK